MRGNGSVKKRPDGRWRARYRDASGKEHARHFKRKVDADRWLDEVTASVVTGQYVDPRAGKVILRDYAEEWRSGAPHSPTMRSKVGQDLANHVYPTFGDMPISAILPSAVQAWVTGLPVAPSTARVLLSRLSSVLRAATRDRLIPTNPTDGVRPPPARKKREVWIPTVDQVWTLRENLPPSLAAVVDLVAGAGLRQGEAFGLEVDELDFLRRNVRVERQLITLPPEPLYLDLVKGKESRVVPLAPVTLDALAAHLAAHPPHEQIVPDRTDPKKERQRSVRLVFTSPRGRPQGRGSWSGIWRPAARAAGFPERVGLHALRHFYASALIAGGASVKIVQRQLGHASAAITLDTYAHLWPDSDDRTRDAVSAALAPAAADYVRTAGHGHGT